MDRNTRLVKLGCYSANITMSIVGNLSALLFLTFRNLYGISYSLLGMLVLINFATQLSMDLLFSFFSHRFNIQKTVKFAPVLSIVGLLLFAAAPFLFPNAVYLGLSLGTVIFSASSGLNEVLLSPVIAALPSDNPEREMSKLHSIYAWGVVAVVVITTLFLFIFKSENWYFLPILFTLVPLFSLITLFSSHLPHLDTPEKASGAAAMLKNKTLLLCVLAIFLGGASEVTMAQWCSSYLEQALGIDKVWGDIFGAAAFAVTLGLGRSLYAKYGSNIEKILFLSGVGATLCYVVCIISPLPFLGLIACALTGLCVAMMWPGSLVVSSSRIKVRGVFVYAMMAAGGDLGASIAPQLVGIVTDAVTASTNAVNWASSLGLTIEQLSMKLGLAVGALFPLLSIFVFLRLWRKKPKIDELPPSLKSNVR